MLKVQTSKRKLGRYEKRLADLDRFGVQFLVVDAHHDKGLVQAARSNPKWAIDFEDREAVLFARVGT